MQNKHLDKLSSVRLNYYKDNIIMILEENPQNYFSSNGVIKIV